MKNKSFVAGEDQFVVDVVFTTLRIRQLKDSSTVNIERLASDEGIT
jgi:hypothetical protein